MLLTKAICYLTQGHRPTMKIWVRACGIFWYEQNIIKILEKLVLHKNSLK